MNNPNPMNSRCGLEDCDCEYTIGGLLRRLELIMENCTAGLHPSQSPRDKDEVFRMIHRSARLTVDQTRKDHCDTSCPCYQAGTECSGPSLCVDHPETMAECPCYQEGYEAERRPVGA